MGKHARKLALLAAATSAGLPHRLWGQKVANLGCWIEGTSFTFEGCCREYVPGRRGHPECWTGGFTFEECCKPELRSRLERGLALLAKGEHRAASYAMFDLFSNYGLTEEEGRSTAWAAFEKSAKSFRQELDQVPHSLSYFEILFQGLNLDCDPLPNAGSELLDPYSEFLRCCADDGVFGDKGCNFIYEMMANALGRRHNDVPARRDEYYGNMSEMWAFHHFTPSMLDTGDAQDPPKLSIESALALDPRLIRAFEGKGEPSLGIVWGDLVRYQSSKFTYGVYYLTRLFSLVSPGDLAIDIFEIGAGYGSLARIVAAARPALAEWVRRYVVLDIRPTIDLQQWYLNKTVGDLIVQRDWSAKSSGELWNRCQSSGCWGATRGDPLYVDFVDTDARDLFCHLYATAHSGNSRGVRLLIAVNSWHEFPMVDFLWYYNAFAAAPAHRMGVGYILYVSNRNWAGNSAKEALLLESRSHYRVSVLHEECTSETCIRILRTEAD